MERTKLHRFMDANRITDTALSHESGVSVRHVKYLKLGEKEATRPKMVAILAACQRLSGKAVAVTDIFDFSVPRSRRAKAAA